MVEPLGSIKHVIPYAQLEEYLEAHQEAIGVYVGQLKRELIDVPEIESKLPKSFLYLQKVITKIL